MRRHQKEIIKLTAKEVLLSIVDLALPFFEADKAYRIPAKKYRAQRNYDRSNFGEKIKYLRRNGLIESFIEDKEKFIEITPKGIEKIHKYNIEDITIDRPARWDEEWRVIIFDIPEKMRVSRDVLRNKIINLGFLKIQESVYVYPFECSTEVTALSKLLSVEENVLIMISEIIQGENNIIDKFIDKNVLTVEDIRKNRK